MIKFCGECGADLRDTNGICPNCASKHLYSSSGIINRVNIKEGAKSILDKHFWTIFKASFFVFIIMLVSTLLVDKLFSKNVVLYDAINMLRVFIFTPLSFGLTKYVLKIVRDDEVKFDDLFSYYDSKIFLVFGVTFLISLFSVLWALLFIIPGVIAYISYSLCNFVLVDNENISVMEILNESKRLTDGYKGDIFMFFLSFCGWYFLSMLTLGIALVYVIPYVCISFTIYYEELKKIKTLK